MAISNLNYSLYKVLENGSIQCQICRRWCKIAPGKKGFCQTRQNVHGGLHSLIYGRVSSIRVSPIEIKPLFHFYPGSRWLSLGSFGCNFRCPGCQNWEISHADVAKEIPSTEYIPPEKLVELAEKEDCKGISWTYNEPTLWLEYTLDTARIAKERGLLTNYITNGYITEEALSLIGPYLDAYRVDLKAFSSRSYQKIANISDFEGVLDSITTAKDKWDLHIELITNVTPGYNDSEGELHDMAHWIVNQMGPDTPWHVTRFVPHLKLSHLKYTPISKLEQARQIGIAEGLRYVYLGNVPGHPAENTYCPQCGELLIERENYRVLKYELRGDKCAFCNQTIAGYFE
jgi:pyruvate formate lyase activating enzyme